MFFPRESAIVAARIIWTRPLVIGQHPRWYVTASGRRCDGPRPRVVARARPPIFFTEYSSQASTPRLRLAGPSPRVFRVRSLFSHFAATRRLPRIAQFCPREVCSGFRIHRGPDSGPLTTSWVETTREPEKFRRHGILVACSERKYASQRVTSAPRVAADTQRVRDGAGKGSTGQRCSHVEVLCRFDYDATLSG